MVNEPQLTDPAPTLTVPVNPDAGRGILSKPVIVSTFVPLIVNTLLELTAAKASEAHWALATFTVTVMPELIVTASAEFGIADPPQVAVLFQFPDTDAVLAAAKQAPVEMDRINISREPVISVFFFIKIGYIKTKRDL